MHAGAIRTTTPRTARQAAGLAFTLDTKTNLGRAQQPERNGGRLAAAPFRHVPAGPSARLSAKNHIRPRGDRVSGVHTVPASTTNTDSGGGVQGGSGPRYWGRQHQKRPPSDVRDSNFLTTQPLVPFSQQFMGTTTVFPWALFDLVCSNPSPLLGSEDPTDLAAFSQKSTSRSFESEALQLALAGCSTTAAGLFGPALSHHLL